MDCRYDETTQTVNLIEINCRYWGSLLASLAAGVNFPYLACRMALGHQFDVPSYAKRRFVDAAAIVKQSLNPTFRGHSWFTWKDTNLPYALSDPLAELVKVLR